MTVLNNEVAGIFSRMADLLEIESDNVYRIRAYRNAARTIAGLPRSVSDMVESGESLDDLPGIGKDLAGKIQEIVETGTLSQLEELEKQTPPEVSELMKIPGLGGKRVAVLHRELGVSGVEDLREKARKGLIRDLEGFGKKTEKNILREIEEAGNDEGRINIFEAEENAEDLLKHLKKTKGIKDIMVAGSYRRRKETVGDLDILVSCRKDSGIIQALNKYDKVKRVVSTGKTKSTVILQSGLQVDLRKVPAVSYGAALHYFTGSKAHNIAVRRLGVKKGLKINEYGVFKGDERIAGQKEEDVYRQVDLPYIEPELRENDGEIEAAQKGRLPKLVTLDDLCGDLHVHTKETDGHNTLVEMAEAAGKKGYEYLAVTEHSKRVTMARGFDARKLEEQIKVIEEMNEKLEGVTLLKGIEVDILKDGSLDLPDGILRELDVVVCAVHYDRKLSKEEMTGRIMKAMDNPNFNILAHPTGRLINERAPYEVDLKKVVEKAKETGCFLEINAHPDRLDLCDRHCRMAKEAGVKLVISTDAHSTSDLAFMRFGVDQARRGWLEAEDVVNTRRLNDLRELLKR
ncbi:MAG: DNA polymerase/3'-5' exonuclease PolX [Thermodesulfobacteriota bacterium]